MIKKQLYIIPETEVLEVRFEENFCGTNIDGWDKSPISNTVWGSEDDDNGME